MFNDDLASLLKDSFDSFVKQVQIGLPCKIIKFDKEKMRADVQPYIKQKNPTDDSEVQYSIIPDVPVMLIMSGNYYIRPIYQNGDMVWVTFSSRNIDTSLDEYNRVESESIFSLENASVVGSITPNKFQAPSEFSSEDGLIIGEKNGNSYIAFDTDNVTFKFASGSIKTKFDATGMECDQGVKAGAGAVQTTLQFHQHSTGGPGQPTTAPIPGT